MNNEINILKCYIYKNIMYTSTFFKLYFVYKKVLKIIKWISDTKKSNGVVQNLLKIKLYLWLYKIWRDV